MSQKGRRTLDAAGENQVASFLETMEPGLKTFMASVIFFLLVFAWNNLWSRVCARTGVTSFLSTSSKWFKPDMTSLSKTTAHIRSGVHLVFDDEAMLCLPLLNISSIGKHVRNFVHKICISCFSLARQSNIIAFTTCTDRTVRVIFTTCLICTICIVCTVHTLCAIYELYTVCTLWKVCPYVQYVQYVQYAQHVQYVHNMKHVLYVQHIQYVHCVQ